MVNAEFSRIAPDVHLGKDVKIFAFVNLYGCEIGDESILRIRKSQILGNKKAH